MATAAPTAKVFAIKMPSRLAEMAEALAARDGLAVEDLFLEAFQAYFVDGIGRPLKNVEEYAASHNPHGYNETDVPRLIDEARAIDSPEAGRVLAQSSAND